jgi:hypothetical protein
MRRRLVVIRVLGFVSLLPGSRSRRRRDPSYRNVGDNVMFTVDVASATNCRQPAHGYKPVSNRVRRERSAVVPFAIARPRCTA